MARRRRDREATPTNPLIWVAGGVAAIAVVAILVMAAMQPVKLGGGGSGGATGVDAGLGFGLLPGSGAPPKAKDPAIAKIQTEAQQQLAKRKQDAGKDWTATREAKAMAELGASVIAQLTAVIEAKPESERAALRASAQPTLDWWQAKVDAAKTRPQPKAP